MTFILHLRSVDADHCRGRVESPLDFEEMDLAYYIVGALEFRVADLYLLNPKNQWPVLFLALSLSDSQGFVDPLDQGETLSLYIPEHSNTITCRRSGRSVFVSEPIISKVSGEVEYQQFLDTSRHFAEDVRTTLLEMNPKFAEHPELGEWFRTPQA